MILDSLKYVRLKGKPNEWAIEGKNQELIKFENLNLIVGKNGVGKSRFLEIIRRLAALLSLQEGVKDLKFPSIAYEIILRKGEVKYHYFINILDREIVEEGLFVDGKEKYNREKQIIYSENKGQFEALAPDKDQIVTSLQGESEDYPFLVDLFIWANSLRNFVFSNQAEKTRLLQKKSDLETPNELPEHTPENIIQLFFKGKKLFGQQFEDNIIKDLDHIGYKVNQVHVSDLENGVGLSVQEDELIEPTIQLDMSQGMFRALAFIIQLNYLTLAGTSECVLVDDLAEGIDFSRAKPLIDILIHKINHSDIQIFFTTNDRYVMNKIPIKYWNIIERMPKASIFYNYNNSKETFEDFKYTGLSNFDFLATDFYIKGFGDDFDS